VSNVELYEREAINGQAVSDYVTDAADAFTRAALDDISWFGDHEGIGANPLDLGAYAWEPVSYHDVDDAWSDEADSPVTQVEEALGTPRAVEIVELLGIDARTFGDRLYCDQNGVGTGFWDMDFSRPEYKELSELIGHRTWQLEYDYDAENDPDGNDVALNVSN
jgi:DNA-binding ferritin-like protein (Dps family)